MFWMYFDCNCLLDETIVIDIQINYALISRDRHHFDEQEL